MNLKNTVHPLIAFNLINKSTNLEVLNQLKEDIVNLQNGWDIYYTVDHHEISKYCFPIDVEKIDEYLSEELESISQDQNAYHELFYNMPHKPILLIDYQIELEGLVRYVEQFSNRVFTTNDIINRYYQEIGLDYDDYSQNSRDLEKITDIIKNHFNNILALSSGLYSIGADRLSNIFDKLLINKIDLSDIEIEFEDLINNTFVSLLNRLLKSNRLHENNSTKNIKKDRADLRDAKAISRVIGINKKLNPHKIMLLYVSNAPKIDKVFQKTELIAELPILESKKFNFHRSTKHLFAYLIVKEEDKIKIIENIDELTNLINNTRIVKEQLTHMKDDCEYCVNHDYLYRSNCQYKYLCDGLVNTYEVIKQNTKELDNLKLVGNVSKKRIKYLNKIKKTSIYFHVIDFLNEVYKLKSEHIHKEEELLQKSLIIKSKFAELIPKNTIPTEQIDPSGYISCYLQRYPLRISFEDEEIKLLNKRVISYLKCPVSEKRKKWSLLGKIFGDFLTLTAPFTLNIEMEIFRNYLYILIQDKNLLNIIENNLVSLSNHEKTKKLNGKYYREISYLLCFLYRYQRNYLKCEEKCTASIKLFPNDPRFYHARSVNYYYWAVVSKANESDLLKKAVSDALVALQYYKSDFEMMAVCHNNLAYIYSVDDTKSYNLLEARNHLDSISTYIDKVEWSPLYPEFWDTEANVLLKTAINESGETAQKIAIEALNSVNQALSIDPQNQHYIKLAQEINNLFPF